MLFRSGDGWWCRGISGPATFALSSLAAFEEFDREKSVYNLMNSKDWKSHELYGKKKEEIFNIWSERNRIAIEKGVILHQDIENYLNKIPIENNSIEFEYFKNFFVDEETNQPKRIINEAFIEFFVNSSFSNEDEPDRIYIYNYQSHLFILIHFKIFNMILILFNQYKIISKFILV